MPELVWDGKYAADGSKMKPVRVALPFQYVETVNESAQERDGSTRAIENGGVPKSGEDEPGFALRRA